MAELYPEQKRKVRKPLLWIALGSITMAFAGLSSGYIISRSSLLADNQWLQFALPVQFYYATVAIFIASGAMVWAQVAAKRGNLPQIKIAVALALLLGLTFALLQYLGWQDLIDRGLFFTGPNSNTAISWVYVITFLHWLHVLSGLIVLLVTLIRAASNAYTKEDHLGLDLSCIYWHFLDVLWLYLFCFLLFIR